MVVSLQPPPLFKFGSRRSDCARPVLALCVLSIATAAGLTSSDAQLTSSEAASAQAASLAERISLPERQAVTTNAGNQRQSRVERSLSEAYCVAIADPARDARYLLQSQKLAEENAALEARVAELKAASDELEGWLKRRAEFQARATEAVRMIYANMRADAAAEQLALLDLETASSVVMQLDARAASDILSEMEPKTAAQIAATLARAGTPGVGRDARDGT